MTQRVSRRFRRAAAFAAGVVVLTLCGPADAQNYLNQMLNQFGRSMAQPAPRYYAPPPAAYPYQNAPSQAAPYASDPGPAYSPAPGPTYSSSPGPTYGSATTRRAAAPRPPVRGPSDVTMTKDEVDMLIRGNTVHFTSAQSKAAISIDDYFAADGKFWESYNHQPAQTGSWKIISNQVCTFVPERSAPYLCFDGLRHEHAVRLSEPKSTRKLLVTSVEVGDKMNLASIQTPPVAVTSTPPVSPPSPSQPPDVPAPSVPPASASRGECRDMAEPAKTAMAMHATAWHDLISSLQSVGLNPRDAEDVIVDYTKLKPEILHDSQAKAALFYQYGVEEAFVQNTPEKAIKPFTVVMESALDSPTDASIFYINTIAVFFAAERNYKAARATANEGLNIKSKGANIVFGPFLSQISGC